jgi:hypothetical protein
MKIRLYVCSIPLVLGLLAIAMPARLAAQSKGAIDFTAQVAPTDGRPEPVRQMTFCLLRKSLDDIRQEALQLEPDPDFDKFVDGLTLSPKLKAWMKKSHVAQFAGADFTKSLTADDIVDIPEFYEAYMSRNFGYEGEGFPKPAFKAKDQTANPEKYKQQKADYKEAIRKFIASAPVTVQGIEADLTKVDPHEKWVRAMSTHRERLEKRTLELAQVRYLVTQTETSLDGHGWFGALAPGSYWISLVGMQAVSGDVRLRWDVPVTVRPGETTHVELTNLNAAKSVSTAQNLDR